MAQATAERTRKSSPPPAAPPPETITPAVNERAEANGRVSPTINAATPIPKTPEEADPFLFMRQFSTDDWRLLTAYLYRTAPITNKRGTESNIQLYVQPFDQDDIMKKHGSGGYRVDLNQDRAEGGGRRRLRQFYFEILNPDYPPVVPAGEWVDDPRNVKWAWAKNNPAGVPGGMGSMNPEGIIRLVLDAVEKARPNVSKEDQASLTNQIVTMIDKNQAQLMAMADPTKQMQMIKGILDSFAPKDDGSMKMFLQMLTEDRKAAREEITRLTTLVMNRPEQKGFLEQLIESEGALTKVKNLFGGGGGSGKTDWGQVIMDVTSRVIEGAAPIGAALIYRATNGAVGQPAAAAGATAATWPPKRIAAKPNVVEIRTEAGAPPANEAAAAAGAPDATPPAVDDEHDAGPLGANLTAQEQAMLMQHLAKYGTLIQQCIPFMVDQYRAGLTGYDFRDWFISRHGMNWWASMRTDLKAEGLLLAARYDADLWKALQPEERAAEFFEQFFTEPGDEDIPESAFGETENGVTDEQAAILRKAGASGAE